MIESKEDTRLFRYKDVWFQTSLFLLRAVRELRKMIPQDTASEVCPYCFRKQPHSADLHDADASWLEEAKRIGIIPGDVTFLIRELRIHGARKEHSDK